MKRFVRLLVYAGLVTGLASAAFAQETAPPPVQSAEAAKKNPKAPQD
jgi:hypothetical protein